MQTWLFAFLVPALMTVQVELTIPGASPEECAAARAGCERALGVGSCHVHSAPAESSEPASPTHRAQVAWTIDRQKAQIRFEDGDTSSTETRELAFTRDDAMLARFEAVGLVVAAYVIGHQQGRADAGSTAPTPATEPPSAPGPTPPEPMKPTKPTWAVDLLFGVGQALENQDPRLAVGLRGALRPWPAPLFLLAHLEGAQHSDVLDVRYGSAAIGIALWLTTPVRALDVQLDLAAATEYVSVSGEHPLTGEGATRDHLRAGGRLGVEVLTCLDDPVLCFLGGVRLNALGPAIRVERLGDTVGRQPAVGVDGFLGLRIGG